MLKTKFKIIAWSTVVLWLVVLMQTVVTRLYVSETAFEQAFARNQIAVEQDMDAAKDTRNVKTGNRCQEGVISGRLSEEQRKELVRDLFRDFGGEEIFASTGSSGENFYVAYGYTRGLETVKRVNGKTINLTVALSYDERKNETRVVVGMPLVNSDF